jgi:hypothetical protein
MTYYRPDAGGPNWSSAKAPRDRTMIMVSSLIVITLLALIALCVVGVRHANAIYHEFMAGCEQDRKHYECMLLWRASNHEDPLVVPVPIVIPNSR